MSAFAWRFFLFRYLGLRRVARVKRHSFSYCERGDAPHSGAVSE